MVPTNLDRIQRERIRNLQCDSLSQAVRLEHHLIDVIVLFVSHGIRSAVLKGGATAHLDYPNPSWREYADVDLLIDPSERIRATALLQEQEWIQRYALPKGH